MYLRNRKWLEASMPSVHSESGWVNEFTTDQTDVVDIRFLLNGYGWKPNAGVQNLVVLERGSYNISIREFGQADWKFMARVESQRAGTEEANVYRHSGFTSGRLEPRRWQVRIEADKASKFTAWGGTLEGIIIATPFWEALEVRAASYVNQLSFSPIVAVENVHVHLV